MNKKLLIGLAILMPSLATASPYADSFGVYASEVDALETKLGYVGKVLPIPELTKVSDGVYMSVGSFIWGNRGNFGFNNNMSGVIFDDGVFVFNAGPNEAVAYSFHQQLKAVTDKPVKWVSIENQQGHANMGASYWHDVGVKNIYSQEQATEHFHKNFNKAKTRYLAASGNVINEPSHDVTASYTSFDKKLVVDVGNNEKVILMNYGGGHTPTMAGAIIPSKNLAFSGDLGFNERLPGLFGDGGDYQKWITSFDKMKVTAMSEVIDPSKLLVIPGHGTATTLADLEEKTITYFKDVEREVLKVIEEGGTVEDARKVDQSKYKDRFVFEQLAADNAESLYNTLTK
jgi:glyoxylase-like metal-dependent hydrolase (beta-lactamase superfamily II)